MMKQDLNLLIVSGCVQNKKALLNIIGGLPLNVHTAVTIEKAWEVLLDQSADVIFCDEILPDGTYHDFLCAVNCEYKMTRFVVLLNSDTWGEYLEAMRLGASDVIQRPYQPIDIELAFIRAARDLWQKEELRLSASA